MANCTVQFIQKRDCGQGHLFLKNHFSTYPNTLTQKNVEVYHKLCRCILLIVLTCMT